MKYEKIKEYSKTEIEQAFLTNDPNELLYVVLSIAMYSEDYEYAENLCINLSEHKHFNVRGNAILGFLYIARNHDQLNEDIVKPLIIKTLKDEDKYVRAQAESARDDIEHFLDWKFD